MEASLIRLRSLALRNTRQLPSRRKFPLPTCPFRAISTTPISRRRRRRAVEPRPPLKIEFNYDDLDPEARREYDLMSSEDKARYQADYIAMEEHMNSPEVEAILNAEVTNAANAIQHKFPRGPDRLERVRPGYLAKGEVDQEGSPPDEEYKGDDISSTGHGELEQHREKREYARIAAWEMPMLSKLAKPFTLPALDQPLRFRYTNYMGETHPAANKIVLEFCTTDLPDLTPPQRAKLIKLVGVRYNPETDNVKMSCEMFETQAQNKRYLGDLVDTLIAEAKNPDDMYEDVPYDFRHHKFKPKIEFPEEWKMTDERREELGKEVERKALEEGKREEAGRITDGMAIIREHVRSLRAPSPALQSKALPEAKTGKKGAKERLKARQSR
ncbi:MAG: hypothetical protein Q9191_003228, partial [Dirinaria sp. TL-2023a]